MVLQTWLRETQQSFFNRNLSSNSFQKKLAQNNHFHWQIATSQDSRFPKTEGEMMLERGMKVDHSTIGRWVLTYSPQIDERTRHHLKLNNDSWKVDETYIKVKGKWKYLYRAVDSEGNTLDFMLSAIRNKRAVKRFFKKVLKSKHNKQPRVINLDNNAAYPPAIEELKSEKVLEEKSENRQVKYLNNLVEQDHRGVKRITNAGLGYQSFHTAWRTIRGIEIMRMIYKGQVERVSKNDVLAEKKLINSLFEIAV